MWVVWIMIFPKNAIWIFKLWGKIFDDDVDLQGWNEMESELVVEFQEHHGSVEEMISAF